MTVPTEVVLAVLTAVAGGIGLVYRDMRRDRDYWRDMAISLRDVNRDSIAVTQTVVRDA